MIPEHPEIQRVGGGADVCIEVSLHILLSVSFLILAKSMLIPLYFVTLFSRWISFSKAFSSLWLRAYEEI